MTVIKKNVNLKPYNTFGIEAYCDFFAEVNSVEDFQDLLKQDIYISNKKLVIGGGSNLLLTNNFKGIVIKNNIKEITILSESENEVVVRAGAGEVWHDLVLWCIENDFAGLENLSLIPGCVGASPMQNIGAYGVEIKEVFKELEAFSMQNGQKKIFTGEECEFGYRESVFKNRFKDQYLIASVTFNLKKHAVLNTTYGAINTELQAMNVSKPTIRDVSKAVINIRQSKLPDPNVIGNAGSFFKNPEVKAQKYNALKEQFPELVAYPLQNGNYKLAAGWLIEQCGLKGYEKNGAAVHSRQALVLVNMNNASGKDIYDLSSFVKEKVLERFGVTLEREVNIIA